jgi:hypothetical protein
MTITTPSVETSNWRPAALSLTVFGAIARLLPHPPNFAPVGATSVFAGARLPGWQAYLIPITLMAVTDPIINASYGLPFSLRSRLWIYFSFLISVAIGRAVRHTESPTRIAGALFLSALQFFVISNFGTWLGHDGMSLYPHTAAGLLACYTAALPFFGWTLLSDFTYAAAFFGLHAWLSRTVSPVEQVS